MRVEQLMSKNVTPCDTGDSLSEVARIMWERDCGSVPVVAQAQEGRVVAMITDRDVCMAAYTTGRPLAELRVSDAMSPALHACRPGDAVSDVEAIMRHNQLHRLPVVDDAGNLAGILSLADLARAAKAQRGRKQPGITETEVVHLLESISAARESAPAASIQG
jgi:CBS domain-containing protein